MNNQYLSVSKYAEHKKITVSKVKKMAPYIQGAFQCDSCNHWLIPRNATPLFVPDRRFYSKSTRNYCYVMDAICEGAIIDSRIEGCCISEQECQTIVRELKRNGKITLLEGRSENSLDYKDYIVSSDGWFTLSSAEKTKRICELLKAIQEIAKIITAVEKP